MKQIREKYVIEEITQALTPAQHVDYQTIVETTRGKIYVKQTPIEIIKHSCLEEFMTYEGRREAVQKLTGYKNKVPILVNAGKGTFIFPTISPISPECTWVIYHHIKKIEDNQKKKKAEKKAKSIIHFFNGMSLEVDISHYTLQNQIYRASICKNMYDLKMKNDED